jgi:hypothetical protein
MFQCLAHSFLEWFSKNANQLHRFFTLSNTVLESKLLDSIKPSAAVLTVFKWSYIDVTHTRVQSVIQTNYLAACLNSSSNLILDPQDPKVIFSARNDSSRISSEGPNQTDLLFALQQAAWVVMVLTQAEPTPMIYFKAS